MGTMSAITVNRAGHIFVGGELSGHVESNGSVIVEGARIGRVERVESTGPRGGAVVEWSAHSVNLDVSPHYRTRTDAVSAVVEAWGVEAPESVESGPRWLVMSGRSESIVAAPDARAALALVVPDHADYSGTRNGNGAACYWHMSTPYAERVPECAVIVTEWTADNAREHAAVMGEPVPAWADTEGVECAACAECRTAPTDAPDGPYTRPDGSVVRVPSVNVSYVWHVPGWAWGVRASDMSPGDYTERGDADPVTEAEGIVARVLGDAHGVTFRADGGTVDGYGSDGDHVVTVECVPYVWTPCGPCVCSVEAPEVPEGATDTPDPVTGVTEADKTRYGSVMAARGARMSHTVTSVENVRGTWNVNATASDGAPEHFSIVPGWGDVRWYARGGECVLPLPVGVTFPNTRTGAVEAVIAVMSGPVQWADGVEGTPCDAFGRGCGGTYGADRVCGTCNAVHASVTPADTVHAGVRSIPGVESTLSRPFTESAHVVVECGGMDVTVTAVDGVWVATFDTDGFTPVHVPLTSTGSVNGVVRMVRDYVESRGAEGAPGVRVVESRAGDYVEVTVDGAAHVFTWTDGRGVVRDYAVTVDHHADYGDFKADPVAWVRAYYADDTDDADDAVPESNGAPLGAVARAALDALSGETDVYWTPTESGTGDVSAVVWAEGNGGNRNTYRVGVFMSDAGTVFNGMDGAGDYDHMVTDDADDAVSFIRNHLELSVPECVVCGESVDYCPGHGSDNYAAYVWAAHDADYHGACRASCRTEGARGVLIVSREYDPDTDVYDGDVYYSETRAEWNPDVSVLDVVDLMESEHLTTSAVEHGPEVWTEGAARGEHVNHYTGVVTETEAYLHGYTDAECAVVAALATGEPWECGGVTVTGVGFRVWDVDADDVDADAVPWFHRGDYPDVDADDAVRFIPLSDGDVLPLSDVMALRESFAPGAPVMEPDNVHRVLHGASTDSAWSGYGVIHDYGDGTWSVVRMTW